MDAVGLKDSQVIAKLRLHPSTNCDTVLAAVMGHGFGTSDERGVYKTIDGGKTWRRTLFRDNKTGAVELVYDPKNAEHRLHRAVGIAALPVGHVERRPRQRPVQVHRRRRHAGARSPRTPACRAGLWGKVGISVSGADGNRVYALIENEPEAACTCPTMRARRGRRSTTTATSASARSTTRASTPIRR